MSVPRMSDHWLSVLSRVRQKQERADVADTDYFEKLEDSISRVTQDRW